MHTELRDPEVKSITSHPAKSHNNYLILSIYHSSSSSPILATMYAQNREHSPLLPLRLLLLVTMFSMLAPLPLSFAQTQLTMPSPTADGVHPRPAEPGNKLPGPSTYRFCARLRAVVQSIRDVPRAGSGMRATPAVALRVVDVYRPPGAPSTLRPLRPSTLCFPSSTSTPTSPASATSPNPRAPLRQPPAAVRRPRTFPCTYPARRERDSHPRPYSARRIPSASVQDVSGTQTRARGCSPRRLGAHCASDATPPTPAAPGVRAGAVTDAERLTRTHPVSSERLPRPIASADTSLA